MSKRFTDPVDMCRSNLKSDWFKWKCQGEFQRGSGLRFGITGCESSAAFFEPDSSHSFHLRIWISSFSAPFYFHDWQLVPTSISSTSPTHSIRYILHSQFEFGISTSFLCIHFEYLGVAKCIRTTLPMILHSFRNIYWASETKACLPPCPSNSSFQPCHFLPRGAFDSYLW